MNHVLTIIVKPQSDKLSENDFTTCQQVIELRGAQISQSRWLAEDEAFEIWFQGSTPDDILKDLYIPFLNRPIDSFCLPETARDIGLFIADMDSTIIQQECIDEIAAANGLKEKVSAITERAMAGELDFNEALIERVKLLKGIPKTTLQEIYNTIITPTDGAETLIKTLRTNGITTALVSGGFTFFTDQIKTRLGFDHARANVLEFDPEDQLTGQVIGTIVNAEEKAKTLILLIEEYEIDPQRSLAIGDGANDIKMMAASGLGIAFHAKEITQKHADVAINHTDLTSVLYLLGIPKEPFQ